MRKQQWPIGANPGVGYYNQSVRLPIGGAGAGGPILYHKFCCSKTLYNTLNDMGLVDSNLKLFWEDGDGNTPTIGPALSATGTPVAGVSTGRVDPLGAAITSEHYDGASKRETASSWVIADSDDFVAVVVYRNIADPAYVLSTRPSGAVGFDLLISAGFVYSRFAGGGVLGTASQSIPGAISGGWIVHTVVVDRSDAVAGIKQYINGSSPASTGCPVGANNGGALAIAAISGGATYLDGHIAAVALFDGPSIADTWTAAIVSEVSQTTTGTYPQTGGAGLLSRFSAAAWMAAADKWTIVAARASRGADTSGVLFEPERTNKVYANINPQNNTGWSVTGGTATTPSDTVALAAAAADWGPNVRQFVPGGSDQVMYSGALTGAAPPDHSISLLLRGAVGGESVDVGLRDSSSGVVRNAGTIVCTTSYQLVQIHGVTPNDTNQQFCLDCDAGDTILFVGATLEEGARCSTLIPNQSTSASAVRYVDSFATSEDPGDTSGSIELYITPEAWSGAEAGVASLLYLSGSASPALWVEGGTWRARIDGTTNLDSGVAPADGVEHKITLAWGPGGQSIDIDGLGSSSSAYDGTLYSSGVWTFESDASITVRELKCYR